MPLLLQPPEAQFIDADGHPYAGGTINTYIPGTDTAKDTWADHLGTVLNQNPIVLDSAGRAIIFGDGEYRFVLRDAAGNLIYDQWTSSIVSDAMQPVVIADTIAEAVRLLGIQDMIDAAVAAEAARAEAAEAALQAQITAEVSRAEAAETALQNALNAEIARAEAAEAHLQSEIDGMGSSSGYAQVYSRYQQTTSVSITSPTGNVHLTVTANPGSKDSTDGSGTVTTHSASGYILRDGTVIGQVGYVNSAGPPTFPSPPNYPWGEIDACGSGSHTYAVQFYVDPETAAATGSSLWSDYSFTAECYILAQVI